MSFNYTQLNAGTYSAQLYNLLLQTEEGGDPKERIYDDTLGNATIGVGFNLKDDNVLNQVLGEGFDFQLDSSPEDREYRDRIRTLIDAGWTNHLEADLDAIMAERAAVRGGRTQFRFNDETEIRAVFDALVPTYETVVTNWAAHYGLGFIPESRERLALVSLAYNSKVGTDGYPKTLGPSLRAALLNDDRAAAWYEIRYNTNPSGSGLENGTAKRRYYESQLFGLYDAGVTAGTITEEQTFDVYRMYASHRSDILQYERDRSAQIAEANTDYHLSGTVDEVQTLEQSLGPAYDYLVREYLVAGNVTDIVIDELDIQVGTEEADVNTINGTHRSGYDASNATERNDLIIGLGGDDEIHGGGGDDVLYGDRSVDDTTTPGGQDRLYGDDGRDYLFGGLERDQLLGGAGNDELFGQGGNDVLRGEGDDDHLFGGTGNDLLEGGAGTDVLIGGDSVTENDHATDLLDGGAGADQLHAWSGDILLNPDAGDRLYANGSGTAFALNDLQLLNADYGLYRDTISGSVLRHSGNGRLEIVQGGASLYLLAEGFQSGDLGLVLPTDEVDHGRAVPAAPVPPPPLGSNAVTGTGDDDRVDNGYTELVGTLGSDRISGLGGNDDLFGNDGADLLYGGDGSDYLESGFLGGYDYDGAGDHMYGEAGNDILVGSQQRQGPDPYGFGPGEDLLDGGSGRDFVSGRSGNDVLYGGTEDDVLSGGAGVDYLEGGDGADVLMGDFDAWASGHRQWSVTYIFSNGGWVTDFNFEDVFFTGQSEQDGADTILGGGGTDLLYGHNGDDQLWGGADGDQLFGGRGADYLDGGDGDDRLTGGHLDPNVAVDDGKDTLFGGDGNDVLVGESGDDYLVGGADNDQIEGDYTSLDPALHGHDYLEGGAGTDILTGGAGDDVLVGGTENDTLYGDGQEPGGPWLGHDVLDGGEGIDSLHGGKGNDALFGGQDDDSLHGGEGDDVLNGGTGNDELRGGAGDDRYIFNVGDGIETIYDDEGTSTVVLGVGINAADVHLHYGSLLIALGNGDAIHIEGYDPSDPLALGAYFDSFVFADGSTLNLEELLSRGFDLTGTDVGEQLYGAMYGDRIEGLAGDDLLQGLGGDDVLDGGAGTDQLEGGEGADVLRGGIGGDLLIGGEGADRYVYELGDGADIIDNADASTEVDRLVLGAGITRENVSLTRTAVDDLVITINGTDDSIAILSYFTQNAGTSAAMESIDFSDGTLWTPSDVRNWFLTGGAGNDLLIGSEAAEILTGNDGSDVLQGQGGDDILDGGSGSDQLAGGDGSDTYGFGRNGGNDVIDNSGNVSSSSVDEILLDASVSPEDLLMLKDGNDLRISITGTADTLLLQSFWDGDVPSSQAVGLFRFTDGTVWDVNEIISRISVSVIGSSEDDVLQGSSQNEVLLGLDGYDQLHGGAGNDQLDGGASNDALYGGDGADTYLIDLTSGTDHISNEDMDTVGSSPDTIQFGDGIAPSQVTLRRQGNNSNDLTLDYVQGTVTVSSYFVDDATASSAVEYIRFADGTVWDVDHVRDMLLSPSPYADRILGYFTNDTLLGEGGGDELYGNGGNDVLNGGEGNDYLDGGDGADTYVFGIGSGQDYIYNDDMDTSGVLPDIVSFEPGIIGSDLTFSRARDDLYVSVNGTSDSLTINDFFYEAGGSGTAVDQFHFSDGAVLTVADLVASMTIQGTAGIDTLSGGSAGDMIVALEGNDVITAGAGNDHLFGGSGDDTLDGGEGADSYYFGIGMGNDVVVGGDSGTGAASADIVRLGAGLSRDNVYIYRAGDDLIIQLAESSESMRIAGHFISGQPTSNTIEAIENADGSGWNSAQIPSALAMAGTSGDDALQGTSSANTILGLAGNDTLQGMGGIDVVDGGDGDDLLYGGDGDDKLRGQSGSDVLEGDAGNDRLAGGEGDDRLRGGSGTDVLEGGMGDDTYIYDSADVLVEAADAGTDTVVISSTYTLAANFENLSISTSNSVTGYGNSVDNVLRSGTSQNSNYYLYGRHGNDSLIGDFGNDFLYGEEGSDVLSGDAGNDRLEGGIDDDTLDGGDGNDYLDGGTGVDWMDGSRGNDTYVLDSAEDVVVAEEELTVIGYYRDIVTGEILYYVYDDISSDTVVAPFSYTLGQYVENLQLSGAGDFFGIGNDGTNTIVGNSGDNIIDGGGAIDSLRGGGGDDTYYVDHSSDAVIEEANAGYDIVWSSDYLYTLGSNVEDGHLLAGGSNLTGNDQSNTLGGNDNYNILDGRGGADILIGGGGDDIYRFDNVGDVAVEEEEEGRDTIESTVSTVLAPNIENVRLLGSANIGATGNGLDNIIEGNSGVNVLSGELGNDIYYVTIDDFVAESLGGGYDTVISASNWILADHIESLTLTGYDAVSGTGNSLNNLLTGNWGANALMGGIGDDTYVVGQGDTVTESAGEGMDTVFATVNWVLGDNIEHLVLVEQTDSGGPPSNGTGNGLANTVTGNALSNRLDGGSGADTLSGGEGNDTYVVDNADDSLIEVSELDIDTVESSISFSLGAAFENLTLTGTAALNGTGNSAVNVLRGNSGANRLDGGTGADTLVGGSGNDTYVVDDIADVTTESSSAGTDTVESSVTWTLGSNVENLTLTGDEGINGFGNSSANVLTGNIASNELAGGSGDDSYYVGVEDIVLELASQGTDTIYCSGSYVLSANVENLTLLGASSINATGNTQNNVIIGTAGNNRLDGSGGADSMSGAAGDDTYVVDVSGDSVTESAGAGVDYVETMITYTLGSNLEGLILIGTAAINGTGNSLDNVLTGNTGNNRLNGGTGMDSMQGRSGDDTYTVDNALDSVTESAGEGTDTVESSISFILGANVERLTLTGSSSISGNGNTLANLLTGNSGANRLDGGLGADTMSGGGGNDVYIVDDVGDIVTEGSSAGTDTIESSISYTLGSNVENLILAGSVTINGTGNSAANQITGNAGANILNGLGGADIMLGGLGDDTYVIDNTSDAVTEASNEGMDTIQSSVTRTLGSNLENLTLIGTSAINGTGNSLNNVLAGNSAANTLSGGAGDDIYYVGSGDSVTETSNQGIDTVMSGITWTLGNNIENLTLTGSSAANGTGNTLANVLMGNSAANTLSGGTGNDTYYVSTGDIVAESSAAGTDVVIADISWTLGANIENLTLGGASSANATGNTLANVLIGNSLNNLLYGNSGDDTLSGAGGNDTLQGDAGNDTYTFGLGDGQDLINNYDTATLRNDVLQFSIDINTTDVGLTRSGDDLILSIAEAADQITVQNYFLNNGTSSYRLDGVRFADGTIWDYAFVSSQLSAGGGESLSAGTTGTDNSAKFAGTTEARVVDNSGFLGTCALNDAILHFRDLGGGLINMDDGISPDYFSLPALRYGPALSKDPYRTPPITEIPVPSTKLGSEMPRLGFQA